MFILTLVKGSNRAIMECLSVSESKTGDSQYSLDITLPGNERRSLQQGTDFDTVFLANEQGKTVATFPKRKGKHQ